MPSSSDLCHPQLLGGTGFLSVSNHPIGNSGCSWQFGMGQWQSFSWGPWERGSMPLRWPFGPKGPFLWNMKVPSTWVPSFSSRSAPTSRPHLAAGRELRLRLPGVAPGAKGQAATGHLASRTAAIPSPEPVGSASTDEVSAMHLGLCPWPRWQAARLCEHGDQRH